LAAQSNLASLGMSTEQVHRFLTLYISMARTPEGRRLISDLSIFILAELTRDIKPESAQRIALRDLSADFVPYAKRPENSTTYLDVLNLRALAEAIIHCPTGANHSDETEERVILI
jgi:hypothetical protein